MKKTLALMLLLAGLTLEARGETLTWNGANGHMTWDTVDTNWLQGGTGAAYKNGDTVVFGDTGSGVVTLAGELAPTSVLVGSDQNYTFAGNGSLTGTMQFTKSGNGTLTINTSNTYTGGTAINGGTLVLGNADALGSGAVTLSNNPSLNLGNQAISNSITLQGNASLGNGTLNGTLNVSEDGVLKLSGTLGGTGTINLANYASLNLNKQTLSNSVAIIGDSATIGGGTLNASLSVGENKRLTLDGDLSGTGSIILANNAKLNLGNRAISKEVVLQGSASVRNGTLNGNLTLADNASFTWTDDSLALTGGVTLRDNAKLDLNGKTLSANVTLGKGTASVRNGTLAGNLIVADNVSYTWTDDSLTLTGGITLGNNASLDLNKQTLSNAITLPGHASIGNGSLNGALYVDKFKRLSLNGDLAGTDTITLANNASLNLGGKTLSKQVTMLGDADIGGGTLDTNLVVGSHKTLSLSNDLSGSGTITLAEGARLDLNFRTLSNPVIVQGGVEIGRGTLNGDLYIGSYRYLSLLGDLYGTGTITLADKARLHLSFSALFKDVVLQGNAYIGYGAINVNLSVGEGKKLTLNGNLYGTGQVSLSDKAMLDLHNSTLFNSVTLQGNAFFGNGTFNGDLAVGAGKTLTLNGNLSGTGKITLGENATLDLGKHTLANTIIVEKSATVRNGTIIAAPTAANAGDAQPSNDTGGAAENSIKLLGTPNLGLLKELAGADSPLMTESLTLTLQNVTIKISDDIAALTNGLFTIDLDSLIDCDLVLENVLLDASALTLPGDFDPVLDAVAFDFGDDVNILQATGLEMYLGDYWSLSANLDETGQIIFTNLVETPEPATGTLSLLALAALSSRRRRK